MHLIIFAQVRSKGRRQLLLNCRLVLTCILVRRTSPHFQHHPFLFNEDDACFCYTLVFQKIVMVQSAQPLDQNVSQRGFYEHEPIRKADEIRLLNLRGGKPEEIIKADLETVNIREGRGHDYDAISYTWADENDDATKCCSLEIGSHGLLLPIPRNCDTVLRRVQKYTNRVWIDAVCINQNDIQERAKQVDLMSMIYIGASRTFAYVGEAKDDSDLVLGNLAAGTWTPPHLLESFFERPYFSRVWVVQEIALSQHIIMLCGEIPQKWTNFMDSENLRQIYTQSFYETFPTVFKLDRQYRLRSATLLDILHLGRTCNASDPRDKVFGLMALVSAEYRLSANYSMSTADLYTQIATEFYKSQDIGMLAVLGNLCYRSDEARAQTQGLPTWVPDWNQCEPTLLQRAPEAVEYLRCHEPIFDDNDATALFLNGRLGGTLDALSKSSRFIKTVIHLSSSKPRPYEKLPSAYGDKSVYIFETTPTTEPTGRMTQMPNSSRRSSLSATQIGFPRKNYAFLVALLDHPKASKTYTLAQCQEKLKAFGDVKDRPRLLDGGDETQTYHLLGFIEIVSSGTLAQAVPWDEEPCTIRIV